MRGWPGPCWRRCSPPRARRGVHGILFYQVETLIFGRAMERALYPERYIIGAADPAAAIPPAYQAYLDLYSCPILKMRYESAELAKITPAERATAVSAAKRMGLNVCGVDMLRSNHGPVIMEVNSSPGLEGIEKATGKDVAGMIIDFIACHAQAGKTKTKGRG